MHKKTAFLVHVPSNMHKKTAFLVHVPPNVHKKMAYILQNAGQNAGQNAFTVHDICCFSARNWIFNT
jgi:hypothetical protein